MPLCEIPVRFHRVGAYPDDLSIKVAEVLVFVPEGASLSGAAGGIVLRIEEEDNGFLAQEVPEAHHLPRLREQREAGSIRSYTDAVLRSQAHKPIPKYRSV